MNVLDLFSGIGGFSLGLERAGMRTVAFCEIEPFQRAVLRKHWPFRPMYHDIEILNAYRLRHDKITVNGICGGFPCQPFSTASRGRRVATDLWPEMQRIIDDVRPDWVIAENVQEEAVAYAARCLNGLGYPTYYRRISAADAGADHIRNRWWLVAHPDAEGELRSAIDAEVAKLPALCAGLWGPRNYATAVRVLDGPADRMDRIGSIGNAVIPQIPEAIGRAIMTAALSAPHSPHEGKTP
jgi:DNA (cytosine-5)-methyltransferase 1